MMAAVPRSRSVACLALFACLHTVSSLYPHPSSPLYHSKNPGLPQSPHLAHVTHISSPHPQAQGAAPPACSA